MSSSNIIQREAQSEEIKPSSSNTATGASPTSLGVPLKDSLSPLKLKKKGGLFPKTKLPLSKTSSLTKESLLSQGHLMMWWKRLKVLPRAIFLWATYRIVRILLEWRNKPPKMLIYPDPRLKRIAEPVDFNKIDLKERTAIVRKMGSALAKQDYGMRLGIAAPQIGLNLRVVIVRGNVMFNPEWTPSKTPQNEGQEACYSVPKKVFNVSRVPYGWVKWTNIDGKPMEDKLKGLPAIVFQHELDHLNGLCCIDIGKEITT